MPHGHSWPSAETATLKRLVAQHQTYKEMSEQLGRSYDAVRQRISLLHLGKPSKKGGKLSIDLTSRFAGVVKMPVAVVRGQERLNPSKAGRQNKPLSAAMARK